MVRQLWLVLLAAWSGPSFITAGGRNVQPLITVGSYPITLGWVIAFLVLILVIVFLVVGVPNPQTVLFLIGGVALARLL
jgi:hypothetical protein